MRQCYDFARLTQISHRMNKLFYLAGKMFGRFVFLCTMRLHLIRPELAERSGAYILALTHQGHVDPIFSCVLIRRPIRWMVRKEFFRYHLVASLIRCCGGFIVNRQGIPVSSIRRAISLAKDGQIVGICPEGGRTMGADAAYRGGRIKKGVCSVAIRAQTPVIPCVMLGTAALTRVAPWLPFKRGKVYVAYGQPLDPPVGKSNRQRREALRSQISDSYQRLYRELCSQFALEDAAIP